MKITTYIKTSAALCLVGLSGHLQAACIDTYGGTGFEVLEGDTVCFLYQSSAVDPIFGDLYTVGDSIFSRPTGFVATSTNGVTETDINSVTGIGTVRVVAQTGYDLETINVLERGNYTLEGSGASVGVSANLELSEYGNLFGMYDTTNLTVNSDLTLSGTHNWLASGGFDMSSTSIWDGINDVDLTLTNTLWANTTSMGDYANIVKTLAGTELITIETTPIPVPAALWLFGSGLLGLATIMRRKA